MQNEKLRLMTEIAMAVALSTVLSFLRLWRMPMGGSVNLEMLPILFVAFRHGGPAGIITGLLHGTVQIISGAYVIHPAQFILDYPLAYGLLGIAGYFSVFAEDKTIQFKNFLIAFIVGGSGRLLAHVFSGVIFFAEYAPEGQSPWIYSLIYNLTYIVPALIIVGIVIVILFKQSAKVLINNN
ncbi:MAG: energy-coupled thiamine transporter ThiT [Halarsenatibacteraceae bacterium]